jgi:hypothetical protein
MQSIHVLLQLSSLKSLSNSVIARNTPATRAFTLCASGVCFRLKFPFQLSHSLVAYRTFGRKPSQKERAEYASEGGDDDEEDKIGNYNDPVSTGICCSAAIFFVYWSETYVTEWPVDRTCVDNSYWSDLLGCSCP